MPPVIPAAAAAFAAGLAAEAGATLLVGALFAGGTAVVTSLVLSRLTGPRGRQQQLPTFQAEARDRQVIVRSAVETRRTVYGAVAVSGPLVYAESTGDDNEFLHLVIPLAGHEVEGIDTVYFDDEAVPLDSSGNGLGRFTQDVVNPTSHSAAIPAPGGTITVPGSVVAVERVTIAYNGETFSTFEYPSGIAFDQDHLLLWSRSGSTFGFSGSSLTLPGAVVTIEYYTTTSTSFVRVRKHLGAADQAADSDLVAESGGQWTTDHRLRGIAYLYVRLQYDSRVFPTGIPNIKALVRGKKLYDPRGGSPTLVQWTDNWALVLRDYLTSPHGLGCSDGEIDDDLIIAAANICDELVQLQAGSPSEAHKRYTANGTINLADRPVDNLRDLLTAGAGAAVFTEGQWKVFAGAYATPTVDIDEDWLRGPVKVRARPPRRELFNGVRGVYTNPDKFWQPTDFPPVTNSTYETQDGGEQIPRDIELPFTIAPSRAQRIGKIYLEEARQGIVVELPCNLKAFQVAVWDNVRLSLDVFGWSGKVFRVLSWDFNQGGIDLVLQETASTVYDWNAGEATAVDPSPDTALPNPLRVAAPSALTLELTADSNRVILSWTAPADAFVVEYQLEYRRLVDAEWTVVPRVSATRLDIGFLLPGSYGFRVKAINTLGVSSDYAELEDTIAVGIDVHTYPVLSSLIAQTWTEHSNPKNRRLNRVAFGQPVGSPTVLPRFVAVGEGDGGDAYILTSTDGISWTERANPKNVELRDVIFAGGQFVAVGMPDGSDAYILTSPDGETWTERSNPQNIDLYGIAYGTPAGSPNAPIYVAVGLDGYVVTSPNGINWTQRSFPKPFPEMFDVVWADALQLFVAVGNLEPGSPTGDAFIFTSPNGEVWTERSNPKNVPLLAIAWNEKDLLCAVGGFDGSDAYILTSADGINWIERQHQTQSGSVALFDICWNGSIFCAAGIPPGLADDAFIATSSDGLIWTERPNPRGTLLRGIVWSGNAFVAVGDPDLGSPSDAYIVKSLQVS